LQAGGRVQIRSQKKNNGLKVDSPLLELDQVSFAIRRELSDFEEGLSFQLETGAMALFAPVAQKARVRWWI